MKTSIAIVFAALIFCFTASGSGTHRFIVTKSATGFSAQGIPATRSACVLGTDGKPTKGTDGKTVMHDVPLPMPQVFGNARIFEGDSAPTVTQMAALFAPAAPSPIDLAQAAITKAYPVLVLLDGQSKIFQHTATGTLAAIPKTVAAATWVQTVKSMAIAGQTNFPAPPNTVADVLAE